MKSKKKKHFGFRGCKRFCFNIAINTCQYSCIRIAHWNVLNQFNEICGIWRGQQSSRSLNTINFHFYFQNFIKESNLCWMKQNTKNAVDRKTQKEIWNLHKAIHKRKQTIETSAKYIKIRLDRQINKSLPMILHSFDIL